MISHPELSLNGFNFSELFCSTGLSRLDQAFLNYLLQQDPTLHRQLNIYRESSSLTNLEISELLVSCAPILENFLADLFSIKEAVVISKIQTTAFNPISVFKKYFVLRRAKKEISKVDTFPSFNELNQWLVQELQQFSLKTDDLELNLALLATHYLEQPEQYKLQIDKLVQWCTRALTSPEGQQHVAGWNSFQLPQRTDHQQLVPTVAEGACLKAPEQDLRQRDGFKLTDTRMDARQVQDEVNYCIYCHDHDGDFCSKGFPVKKGNPDLGFKKNPLDNILTGCPLEEKISEMQFLKMRGHTLASLAVVMIDNPMCPATGHRICNDCMKACIYQKQDPVNIPQIETRVLTDVLDLPWGVEIYDLLTRWNPLRKSQWIMKPYNGLKVLIAGMGPAGFTLAHHLLLEGFAVVGFDGLKIEPLAKELIEQPIYRYDDLTEALDERVMAGFGGVAEYGITVRWDKNFLKLIYLSLMRRPYFQVFGGVRFGGTINVEDAWELGFDHFVVAVGAGLPKSLSIPGSLAPGMRQANDFLMALQLGNAAKSSSITNLQIRLPAVVIGGGLTGVDTATELQAYYISQVEKILHRYEILVASNGEQTIRRQYDAAELEILDEYLRHGEAVRSERERSKLHGTQPDFIKLIREWGGVTIAYRRSMQESPAYINNHEELRKALQEGIYYREGLEPFSVELDTHGHAQALICRKRERNDNKEWVTNCEEITLPAKSILVATGTQPNTAYEFEYRGTFNRQNSQYQHYEDKNGELIHATNIAHSKDPHFGPFTSYEQQDKRVSLIGDTHPVFHGSVVKAIASGMRTYPKIVNLFHDKIHTRGDEQEYELFNTRMNHLFSAYVVEVSRKTPDVIELIIQAPLATRHFKAGQFYRLQNFETLAIKYGHTLLQMEPLALVTAECDKQLGRLTFIVNEDNAAAKLCATLKPGEPISLMGPTGVRAKIPSQKENVLVIGDRSSFAFLRCYGNALRDAGHHVTYLGIFNDAAEVYCQTQLENATDQVVWLIKNNTSLNPSRQADILCHDKAVIDTLMHHVSLNNIDRIFVIGDTNLLREIQQARSTAFKSLLNEQTKIFGSVYGNMQCMLKGVCAQCLQWQIDPETGQRTKAVFTCSWQDQPLEIIDIDHIDERATQNRLMNNLNNAWLDYIFNECSVTRV